MKSFYRLYSLEWRISIDSRHYNVSVRPHDLYSNNTLNSPRSIQQYWEKKYFLFSLFHLIFEWIRTFNPLSQVEFWKVTRHFCNQKSSEVSCPSIYKMSFTGNLWLTLFSSASSNYILLYQGIRLLEKEKKQIYFLRSAIHNIQTR